MTLHTETPTAWPTQLMLPGQVAAPEGPIDMTMMYVMHHGFRRDLRAFAASAEKTPVTDRMTWQSLANRWDLFSQALHHHHRGEDDHIWPALMDRAEECERAVLEAMEAEHGEIDPMLEASSAAYRTLALTGDEAVRAELAATLKAAVDSLGRHLAHEESEAIPLIQKYIAGDEWTAIEETLQKGSGPAFVIAVVPWLMHELPVSAQARLAAEAGLPMRVVWRLTRGAFARRERIAFRYAA
ncbi:hemerythrin domain-containing protein [Intrasporangium sp.]|uniref:hemerythrin domain-containing protein n=1 Tax=Intrasporangium sp. TaxID=1925024 RepID=UPI003F822188